MAGQRWYENLTGVRELSSSTAVRHFIVMHQMMEKASSIWSKETGIDRNPADQVEVHRPDDSRDRFLSEDELRRLKRALDDRLYRKGTSDINKTNLRLRLLVLIAVATGMRASEIFGLHWSDVMYSEGLIAVRSKLKGGRCATSPCRPSSPSRSAGIQQPSVKNGFCRRSQVQKAGVREWREASMICSVEHEFTTSVSTICVTPSRPGT